MYTPNIVTTWVTTGCVVILILYACAVEGSPDNCNELVEAALERFSGNSNTEITPLQLGNSNSSVCQYLQKEIDQCLQTSGLCNGKSSATENRKRSTNPDYQKFLMNGGRRSKPGRSRSRRAVNQHDRTKRSLESACYWRVDCSYSFNDKYRTFDGSCNNLDYNYEWGMADRIQTGYLWADYDDFYEDYGTPRTNGLPNPRHVSEIMHTASAPQEDAKLSLFFPEFGQLIAHDIALTEEAKKPDGITPLDCCGDDSGTSECFEIIVPKDDGPFKFGQCLEFARSKARVSCDGVREQVNSQSAFIDCSMVYGTTKGESDSLRTMSGGLMKTDGDKLPPGPDGLCITSDSINNNCLLTGDVRAAEQPGLTSLHTIFVREHNRLANALASIFLVDEIIFQEARRINIAQLQHIVYNEFLPAAIGQADVDYFDMNVWPAGYYHETYNIGVDATIRNEFAGGILRFGHSLISGNIGSAEVDDETLIQERNLKDTFFRPDFYHANFHSGTDNILKYTTDTASLKSDRKIDPALQHLLFFDALLNISTDLAARNIQRGRDHGIPSYNAFRNYCWLPVATCFEPGVGGFVDHDEAVIDLLKLMYTDPNDVDLFTGFLSENRLSGSQLGPTGQCLFIEQLKALRDGDRFFYERPIYGFRSQGFTIDQLNEIKTITMAKLFCLNTAQASGRVPSNMFFQQGPGNDYLDCSNVNGINVNYWNY